MAWTSGFFNSVNGDRLYNSDQMSSIFEGLITDGVYESVAEKLAVQPNNGMTIQIATGRGWFGKRWVNNDSEYIMKLENSDVILNRYAAVVIKVDSSDSVRDAVPYIKYSSFATTPVKPAMTRTETVKEFCLAYVYIAAGATQITASAIEDTRADESVCGWVTGLITQIGTATLFAQYDAIFKEFMTQETATFTQWIEGLRVTIDDNIVVKLTDALPTALTVNLEVSGWVKNGSVYNQSVTVPGMNSTKSIIAQGNPETLEEYSKKAVECSAQATNTLTFKAATLPTSTVKVDIIHMGV